jgi:hypothetical protein
MELTLSFRASERSERVEESADFIGRTSGRGARSTGSARSVSQIPRLASLARNDRRVLFFATSVLLAACNGDAGVSGPDTLPDRLSDSAFWALTTESSEPGGYFRSENFLSNERTFQYVIPALATRERIGRAYLGVGPEQNFTYIVALKPKIAFIVDIRRQAFQQHLLYKAVAELSPTRAEFLSRLFSRQLAPLDSSATPAELFEEARAARADPALFTKNLVDVLIHLRGTHGFTLDSSDMAGIRHVYSTFYDAGPDITYDFPRNAIIRRGDGGITYRPRASSTMPNYSELMMATDADGVNRSYLATEASYGVLRDLHARNLIVPVTGDFAGPKALRAVGAFLKEHNASVAAIYTSNVEQYLFQQGDNWKKYYDNVGQLPLTPATVFIRSMRPTNRNAGLLGSMLSPTQRFLDAYKRGRIRVYTDLRDYSNQ